MDFDWNAVLVIGGAVLILVEVALGGFAGFDLVLIGSAALLGGALGLLFGSTSVGLAVASIGCVAYIVAGRRIVRRRIQNQSTPTNTDALVGSRAIVTERVAEHAPGQVKVRDEVWRATPADGAGPFDPGAIVTVASIDGVTLQVR
jgi:membrane protein implicated in regulation of membrane protease activity